jgi:hypothetical protein
MKARTVALLLALLATAILAVADFAHITGGYLLATPVVKTFDSVKMTGLPLAGSTYVYWIADSPVSIESNQVLFGNVTLCCVQAPSTAPPPQLFILTTDQMSRWKDSSRGPTEWVAQASLMNYTFSGPERTETLSFRINVGASDVYHFVVWCHQSEKPTLHEKVMLLDEALIVKIAIILAPIFTAVALIVDYKWSQ